MTADDVTNIDATSIPSEAILAAANALGAAFDLGVAQDTADWPTGPDVTVLVAGIAGGGLDGGLLLAVDGDTAARITEDPARLVEAFGGALAAFVSATGLALEIGEIGTTDVAPTKTVQLHDGSATTAHVGLVLDPETPEADPHPAPTAGASATSFDPAPIGSDNTVTNPAAGPLTLLQDVEMNVTVELGRTTMPIRDLLSLQPGMVVEIDRAAGSPIDVLVNGRLIACGEVVVIDEEFGIRVTEIVGSGTPM